MTFDVLFKLVAVYLESIPRQERTQSLIKSTCEDWVGKFPQFKSKYDDLLISVQKHIGAIAYSGSCIGNSNHVEWLTETRISEIKWNYSDAYWNFVLTLPPDVKNEMNRDMIRVLGRLKDPKSPGPWTSRGLVMGSIQSGKTANYIGLMAKAMDSGYKVVIVLTGIHESLRSQTQDRINEGILGYAPTITKGKITRVELEAKLPRTGYTKPFCLTTSNADFRASSADIGLQQLMSLEAAPLVFVVKKCAPILKNLYSWLAASDMSVEIDDENSKGRKIIPNVPALIIDDEADQASVDTEVELDEDGDAEGDPTVINALTRGLCNLFEKNSYVAFTATPFANILIHDELESGQYAIKTSKDKVAYEKLQAEIILALKENKPKEVIDQLEKDLASIGLSVHVGQDLFPHDFVYALKPPKSYFGAGQMFGEPISDSDENSEPTPIPPIIVTVLDAGFTRKDSPETYYPIGHDKTYHPGASPHESLKTAIMEFMLLSAQKNLRNPEGKDKINSMLIHVTRFMDVQAKLKTAVAGFVDEIFKAVSLHEDPNATPVGKMLSDIYNGNNSGRSLKVVSKEIKDLYPDGKDVGKINSFSEIYNEIRRIFTTHYKFDVLELHGNSNDALIYKGKSDYSVIVIGGNKLSRGLTLENLLTSYYLRKSDTYDTLLQMGRWFGYRQEYIDLVRVYTTDKLINRFRHLAIAISLLRKEFDELANTPGATPKDFGLKILSHPEMNVTSLLKLRHGTKYRVSFSGETRESFQYGKGDRIHNENAVKDLAKQISNSGAPQILKQANTTVLCQGVKWELVVAFLENYRLNVGDSRERIRPLVDYIRKMVIDNNELTNWDIYFRSSRDEENKELKVGSIPKLNYADVPIISNLNNPFVRSLAPNKETDSYYELKATGGSSDESMDIPKDIMNKALDLELEWAKNKALNERKDPNEIKREDLSASPRAIRHARNPSIGRLIFFPLVFRDNKESTTLKEEKIFWGVRISLPGSSKPGYVEFVVNPAYLRELTYEQEVFS